MSINFVVSLMLIQTAEFILKKKKNSAGGSIGHQKIITYKAETLNWRRLNCKPITQGKITYCLAHMYNANTSKTTTVNVTHINSTNKLYLSIKSKSHYLCYAE